MSAWIKILLGLVIVWVCGSMLMPALSGSGRSPIARSRMEMRGIESAIDQYFAEYNRWPIRIEATNDFTFGTISGNQAGTLQSSNGKSLPFIGNSEKIPIKPTTLN